jgi:hypothetical protein
MKRFLGFVLMFALAIFIVPLFGQTPTEVVEAVKNAGDPMELFTLTTAITVLVINFAGYIAPFIPGIKDIPSTTYQVLVFAVLIIVGGIMFGWLNIWQAAFGYFISTNLYTHVLKWLAKTPKSEAAKK